MIHSFVPRLEVLFYKSESGREPVRDWLRSLDRESRRTIGEDIATVQIGWPLGMPLVRNLGNGLWETRLQLRGRTARVIFPSNGGKMVLLHGFFKKTRATPRKELEIARWRAVEIRQGGLF